MSKKIVAMLMAVAMAFSLLPVTAFATDGPSATTTKDVVDGYYNDHNQWVKGEQTRSDELQNTVTTVNKTAKKVDGQDNQYEVTLKVEMKHKKTAVPPGAAATVLVIDTSGSMEDDTKCSKEEHVHDSTCYTWEACTQENHPLHYVWWKGEYVHIPRSSCKWDGNKYVYQRLICNKEAHKHGKNCETTSRIEAAKVAAKNFLNSYRGGTVSEDGRWTPSTTPLNRYVSIVSFNKYVSKNDWVDVSTKDGYNAAIASINDLSADGGTNLDAGLRMANAQLKNDTVKNMPADVVVLTDGKPTYHLEKAENQKKDSGVEIEGVKYSVKGYGYATSEETYDKTVSTATTLKQAASVYTVCFGASNEKLEAKDKPTVSKFLRTKIATQAEGKTYAYDANDTTDLYKAFAAISSSVVSGLNTGTVEDALPAGVSCTQNGIFDDNGRLTWELKAGDASRSKADEDGFITYTYEKKYTVKIDPAAKGLNVVDGYVPLNQPTKLTVKDSDNQDVTIPFPIPAGKVTYSLTDFNKELVTSSEQLSFSTDGFTIPANTTDPVVVSDEGVTLLYKITVAGNAGAKFTVTDTGATLVSPKDDTITTGDNSTFSGAVDDTGTTVFYVSKHFTKSDIDSSRDTKTVSNTAIIAPGDNANGPDNDTATETTPAKEPDPETYTVTYQWKEGTEVPEGATLPNAGSPIPVNVGETHNVADNPTSNVTKNKAGDSGKWTCEWDKNGAVGSTATAGSNIVITGTWKFTKDQPKTGNLIVKKVVSGDDVTLNDLPNITITVAPEGEQTPIELTLTGTNYSATTSDNNTIATWTIPNLTPGTYTVSEENAGVDGYTYKDTYTNSKNTDTGKSVTVEVNDTITMTVTNTYTKNATVNLSQLIQKQLTVKKNSTLPDNTMFSVTVTPKTVNNVNVDTPQPIPGTVSDLGTGTTNGDGDTIYTASFDFTGGTLSLSAGTYTYTVQENATSLISGMQYDSKEYTLTITVNNDSTYTATYAAEATTETKATPLTIKNTYQAPDLSVEKKTVSVDGKKFDSNTVARVGNKIIWSVTVTNKNSTPARVTLTDAMAEGVYTDDKCETQATNVNWNASTHSWTATVSGDVTYYVNYTVKADDIPKGEIVNTIVMKNGDEEKDATSDPVSTWDTKQLKSATGRLETSDWTTTVTLTLPKVNENKKVTPAPIAVKSGSYVIDQIGNKFTFMDGLSLTVGTETYTGVKDENTNIYKFSTKDGKTYPDTVTYDDTKTPAQFTWNINKDVYAGTEVTLSYKLKLDNPNKTAGTHGVKDLNGDGKVDGTDTAVDPTEALYTNESAILYNKEKTKLAEFPKPSVFYTVSSGNSGSHSGGSRPSLNTKDHYGYIIGYPVDYYTGQPTTDQTKKPVRPEGKITRAEVATIYFRMLTDESRTKFWSQSNAYSDVKAGDWFNNAVSTLSNAGIIAGYEDGSFRPNGYITRAEFATIAARFFDVTYNGKDLFPDISGHWAKDYINQAANKGFVNGYEDGTFKPDRNITRAEAVTLVNRTLDRHPDKSHFTKDMLVWPDNMDQTKWYYADMQEATNSHTYQMKENSDKTKYENWTKTLPIRNWEALEKAWSNANSSQGNGNVV